jgi:putative ABC transport system permease protein
MLRKSRTYTAIALVTLALGIGANTALFSVVNTVLLHPLPYPASHQLVMVWGTNMKQGASQDVLSYPDFEDWRAQSRSFDGMAAFTSRGALHSRRESAEIVSALQVTPGLFEMLRIAPTLGRTFQPQDQKAGAARVVLLGNGFWKSRFAGRPDVVGQTVRLNEEMFTVIGVMPAGFELPPGPNDQVFMPLMADANRNHGFVRVIARLRPGVSVARAQAEMDVIAGRLAEQYPKSNRDVGARVQPLVDAIAGPVRPGLLLLLGVVGLVLLISCSNVANLTLSRAASRQRELAVRAALGASPQRLAQQLLIESTLLALGGGALGLLVADASAHGLASMLAQNFDVPRIDATRTDAWVMGFTLLLSLATGLVFGVSPALAGATQDPNEPLRESARTTTDGLRGRRVRALLVIAETSLAVVLLAGAGVLLRSLMTLRATAPGFQTEKLLAIDFWLPRKKLAEGPARQAFLRDALARVDAVPGVRSAALVADLPLGGDQDGEAFHIVGRPDPAPGELFSATFNVVSPGYYATMGIPLRAGREFSESDANGAGVIVINQTAAHRFWPGEDPLGKQILVPETGVLTVAGVAADVRQLGLGIEPRPEVDLCSVQPGPGWPWLVMVVRTEGDAAALSGIVKAAAQSVDPDVPVAHANTMSHVVSASLARPRTYALLLAIFAALALVLASVGLYGVVSYMVEQRTHEMGVRIVLGAERQGIFSLVLRQGLGLSLAGSAIGLAGAVALTRLLSHQIPEVRPGDPWTFAAVTGLLLLVTLAACVVPARRAMRADPIVALRYE